MVDVNFQTSKVKRLINTNGNVFVFERNKKNEFGEDTDEKEKISVKGIFHQTNSFVTETSTDASVMRSKPQPMIMCLNEEAAKIKVNDKLSYKKESYKVVDITDVANVNICKDVSLEVVQSG